jgi:hypothetical protein
MKEITAYLSKDGVLFKDLKKCLEHEINLLIKNKRILFFSEGGYEVNTTGYNFSYLFKNSDFIKISEDAWSTVHRFCKEEGLVCPNCFNNSGVWEFDYITNKWVGVKAKIIHTFENGYFLKKDY